MILFKNDRMILMMIQMMILLKNEMMTSIEGRDDDFCFN